MTTSTYSAWDAVTVRRIFYPLATPHQPSSPNRMRISQADRPASTGLRIPYSPVEVTHTAGADYADVSRAARKPALVYLNASRKEMTMTLYVADKYVPTIGKPTAPTLKFTADAVARQLTTWANNGTRLRVEYGSFENGTWRITSISTRSIQRGWETNNFTVAEITLTFTEVVDMKVGTGPVSGGTRAKTSNKKATKSPTRTYTVRKGDTLTKISQKYYGTASKWRKIADANKIKNPNKIRIGQKLKIPK